MVEMKPQGIGRGHRILIYHLLLNVQAGASPISIGRYNFSVLFVADWQLGIVSIKSPNIGRTKTDKQIHTYTHLFKMSEHYFMFSSVLMKLMGILINTQTKIEL